jgi:hypothetical protein
MTWREVIYDVYTSLRQNVDDSKLTLRHVMYWVGVAGNRLLMQHIDKRDSGAFKTAFIDIPVEIDTDTGYKYIQLPSGIFDFNRDGGVVYLSYSYKIDDCTPPFTSVQFSRTSVEGSRVLYYTDEEKPSPSNPYFYRIGNKLYLLGVECVNVTMLDGAFYQTIDTMECDLDEQMPFPDELVAILQKYVFDLGRWVLTVPEDYLNDGRNKLGEMPTSKLVSVNNEVSQAQQSQQQE